MKRDKGFKFKIYPIDHGLCLPDNFDICEYEISWTTWPQIKKPFSEKMLLYISQLDTKRNASNLRKKLKIREICLRNYRVSETLLKQAAERGLNLFDISKILYKDDHEGPKSLIEKIVEKAEIVYHRMKTLLNKNLFLQLNQLHTNKKKSRGNSMMENNLEKVLEIENKKLKLNLKKEISIVESLKKFDGSESPFLLDRNDKLDLFKQSSKISNEKGFFMKHPNEVDNESSSSSTSSEDDSEESDDTEDFMKKARLKRQKKKEKKEVKENTKKRARAKSVYIHSEAQDNDISLRLEPMILELEIKKIQSKSKSKFYEMIQTEKCSEKNEEGKEDFMVEARQEYHFPQQAPVKKISKFEKIKVGKEESKEESLHSQLLKIGIEEDDEKDSKKSSETPRKKKKIKKTISTPNLSDIKHKQNPDEKNEEIVEKELFTPLALSKNISDIHSNFVSKKTVKKKKGKGDSKKDEALEKIVKVNMSHGRGRSNSIFLE